MVRLIDTNPWSRINGPDAALTGQVRCMSALFTMHAGMVVLRNVESDPEDRREAVLEVAIDGDAGARRHAHPRGAGPAQTVMPLVRRKATGSTAVP
jgi:hypothetical protein